MAPYYRRKTRETTGKLALEPTNRTHTYMNTGSAGRQPQHTYMHTGSAGRQPQLTVIPGKGKDVLGSAKSTQTYASGG